MKRVNAQLAPRPGPGRYAWYAVGLALVLASAAFASAWQSWRDRADAESALSLVQNRAEQQRRQRPALSAPPSETPRDQALRRQRSVPWPSALTAIEAINMVGVTPTLIEYQVSDETIRLTVDFAEHAVLLEYIDALNEGAPPTDGAWRWSFVSSRSAQGAAPGTALLVGASSMHR